MTVAIWIVITGLLMAISLSKQKAEPQETAVCQIVQTPKDYLGLRLRIRGNIYSDKENLIVWDSSCSNNPLPWYAAKDSADLVSLRRLLKMHGTSDHPVIATLSGTLRANTPTPGIHVHRFRYLFEVDGASNVMISTQAQRR